MFYELAYRLGLTPWENASTHPAALQHIITLFDREEAERQPPYGRALDLGCGRGHWTVTLAQRGWSVTGVELVTKAAKAAEKRVREAKVAAQIVQGDITALRELGVDPGFQLVWDFGTVHGLARDQRLAVGREVDAVAAHDATMLFLAWSPGRRGPLPRGMSREELEEAFPQWNIVEESPFDVTGLPRPLRNVNPRVYRLKRTS